jgi:hypothetical protein
VGRHAATNEPTHVSGSPAPAPISSMNGFWQPSSRPIAHYRAVSAGSPGARHTPFREKSRIDLLARPGISAASPPGRNRTAVSPSSGPHGRRARASDRGKVTVEWPCHSVPLRLAIPLFAADCAQKSWNPSNKRCQLLENSSRPRDGSPRVRIVTSGVEGRWTLRAGHDENVSGLSRRQVSFGGLAPLGFTLGQGERSGDHVTEFSCPTILSQSRVGQPGFEKRQARAERQRCLRMVWRL